jgi:hypothetical protein
VKPAATRGVEERGPLTLHSPSVLTKCGSDRRDVGGCRIPGTPALASREDRSRTSGTARLPVAPPGGVARPDTATATRAVRESTRATCPGENRRSRPWRSIEQGWWESVKWDRPASAKAREGPKCVYFPAIRPTRRPPRGRRQAWPSRRSPEPASTVSADGAS